MNHVAKTAIDTVLDIFQHTKTLPSWIPKFIDLKRWCGMAKPLIKSRAIKTIKTYPGNTVAEALGIDLKVEHGDWSIDAIGTYSYTYKWSENIYTRRHITMRAFNMEVWLHELCHAVASELDVDRFTALVERHNPSVTLETEACLGAAALLAAWKPEGYMSEALRCFSTIKTQAMKGKCDPLKLCDRVRRDVERQVAMILETENE
jgi:hypothetical protein